jgi:hypothetical protein
MWLVVALVNIFPETELESQGDQIVRIFAYWLIVYFGYLFTKFQMYIA